MGGGSSQFATALYNAVFYGGFEDVAHTPMDYHSTRYPAEPRRRAALPRPRPEVAQRLRPRRADQDGVHRDVRHRHPLQHQAVREGRGRRVREAGLHPVPPRDQRRPRLRGSAPASRASPSTSPASSTTTARWSSATRS
ncbi:hypothetical protein ACFSTC_07285 [Nonomuraea ferruginea]